MDLRLAVKSGLVIGGVFFQFHAIFSLLICAAQSFSLTVTPVNDYVTHCNYSHSTIVWRKLFMVSVKNRQTVVVKRFMEVLSKFCSYNTTYRVV